MIRFLSLAVVAALVATACSSGNGDVAPVTTAETSSTTTEATTQTAVEEEAQDEEDAAPDVDLSEAEAAVIETWTMLLDAAASGAPTDDQLETIAALSDDDTTTQLTDFFPEAPAREITYHPKITEENGTIAVDDCIIMNRGFSTGFSNWLLGQAEPDPESPTGYIITTVQLLNLEPCVPTSIAEAAIAGYEAHLDAREEFFNPPDPESPLLSGTTTGEQLEGYIELANQFRNDGQTLTGRPGTDPGIESISSPTELVIVDCQETSPDYGVYDSIGGRTDLIDPVVDGQLDLRQLSMELVDGTWKVALQKGSVNVQCKTAPLPPTIQIAGG